MSPACRLLVLRHARTAWNAARRIQGRSDIGLDEVGRKQASRWKLPDGFSTMPCISSPLRRARETAMILGLEPIIPDPRLVEMNWGAFEGMSLARLRETHGEAMAANEARGLDFRPPGGESPREVAARLRDCLADLACAGGADCVIVTHRGVMRALLAVALGWDMLGMPPMRLVEDEGLLVSLGASGDIDAVERVALIGGQP